MKSFFKQEKPFVLQTVIIMTLLCLLPAVYHKEFFVSTLCLSVIWGMMGLGWNILGGYTGQVSNGHAMYFAIGAYVGAIALKNFGLTPWVSMWIGALICAGVAFVVGWPLLRLRGHFFSISTMAIVECVRIIFTNWKAIGGATGINFMAKKMSPWYSLQFSNRIPFYYICLAFMLAFIIICKCIERSKFGYYCRAIKANQDSAEAAGVNAAAYKRAAYVISAAMVSIGGALFAQYIQYIDPLSLLPLSNSMLIVLVVIMGGIGTIWGPIFGAFIMTFINQYARALFNQMSGLNLFIYGILTLFIVLFIPNGLMSLIPKGLFKKKAAKEVQ